MAIMGTSFFTCTHDASTMMSGRLGITSTILVSRLRISSTQPPKYPALMPTRTLSRVARAPILKPSAREDRVP